jgi:hypothetical protein
MVASSQGCQRSGEGAMNLKYLLCVFFFLQGCHNQSVADKHKQELERRRALLTPESVDILFFTNTSCDSPIDSKYPPSIGERENFRRRRKQRGINYIKPLNPKCIFKVYTYDEIVAAANKGDPVAEYALAYRILREKKCNGYGEARNLLSEAFRTSSDEGKRGGKSRIPEAGWILYRIAWSCGGLGEQSKFENYYRKSRADGFEPPAPIL